MAILEALIVVATAFNGILAGISVEVALVKLPTRKRIGALAYANFARGSDLGNGVWVYPTWAIGAALLTFAATLVALVEQASSTLLLLLVLASLASIGHFLATAQAAPTMLRVAKTPNDPQLLAPLLDRFARWHAVRAILQALAFSLLIWSMLVMR
jgi:hypothetical protein